LSFAGLVGLIFLSACSTPSSAPLLGSDSGSDAVDQIRLVAIPVALNLDRRPGVDGFGVKVYGLSSSRAKPQQIRQGSIDILMYDGLLPLGTNALEPKCTWSYTATDLRQYELKSTIGLAYQIAPRWGTNRPAHTRITVMARYKPAADTVIESAPSVITVPQ
jgi:hypothetical protein